MTNVPARKISGLVFATTIACLAPGAATAATAGLGCDDSLKVAFKPDAETTVLRVKKIRQGTMAPGYTGSGPGKLAADLCWVKLLVGPGIPGPAEAPSTSKGIAIEVWLPEKTAWNGRIHALGTPGWSTGGTEGIVDKIGTGAGVAAMENAVTSTTDSGLASQGGNFTLRPDGSINVEGWRFWSYEGLYQQALKTKALTAAYYGAPAKYAYFSGISGGGRQALHVAQNLPEQYDGIYAGVPAPEWSSLITSVYPSLIAMRDLGGEDPKAQLDLASRAAVKACDVVDGKHLGFILDIRTCRYDPTKDSAVLCKAEGGTNGTAACLTRNQALAMNKIWYGLTVDGSVPDPAVDNGWDSRPTGKRKWYGYPRGGSIRSLLDATTWFGGPAVGRDLLAIALRDPKFATPRFKSAAGSGENGWKDLTYEELAGAYESFKALNASMGFNSNNPDLTRLRNAGTKLLHVTHLHDSSVWVQGHTDYYDRVVETMGGRAPVQSFYKFYILPAVSHGMFNGSAVREVNPPMEGPMQVYDALVDWVEKGVSPDTMVFKSPPSGAPVSATSGFPPSVGPEMSLPACAYPTIPTHVSGDILQAESYRCK